ncbi:MAG: glycosyltransferase, partial [Gaiellaceae bacterium]
RGGANTSDRSGERGRVRSWASMHADELVACLGDGYVLYGEWLRRRHAVPYERLPAELAQAGCALGVFGTSAKALRVIPNKAFQALACAVPLVTADTPGARELLADENSALLVPPGDAEALADAVRRLARDQELSRRVGAGGHAAYSERASEDVLGRRWRALFERLL